ncbi:hypothetical protein AVEN_148894-1 [Araneus ventricosus]|uniref:Uncharacterized protein n=1 Tax=Araneus ventricosus TaxID=182803 RepID=A0A4Y2DKZ8_ARAVE|nr:hypothetical protein AVEN_148894-1 [Araneus ventricosus]
MSPPLSEIIREFPFRYINHPPFPISKNQTIKKLFWNKVLQDPKHSPNVPFISSFRRTRNSMLSTFRPALPLFHPLQMIGPVKVPDRVVIEIASTPSLNYTFLLRMDVVIPR